ncbi:MAG: sirohydrochlorin cobaltochelatase [Desulfobulbaceae bacterium]|nr:sirohydrochlorin cobaltochelatase [Desulfobulbaceae bacterium]
MYRKITQILLFFLFFSITTQSFATAGQNKGETAIVLASFGTTVPEAVTAITNISDKIKQAFPGVEVRTTFTSNIIRSIWKKRRAEPQEWLDMGVPEEILYVKNIISTIGDLREDGYRNIIVQPSHMYFMEQSQDLQSYVDALGSIRTTKDKWRPFDKVVMGRPALGMPGDRYDYHEDMEHVVKILARDIELARKENAMLIYMGHGNAHWSTGIYQETQKKFREIYPDVQTFIGVVEGYPALDDFISHLSHGKTSKIMLKPFMIVAGDHAVNDMAGNDAHSWKSILTEAGYTVVPVLEGLGANDFFAEIFTDHIRDVAKENGIALD